MKEKIAGGLLGLIFVVFGLNYFLNFLPNPPLEDGSPPAVFIGAMYGSGYLGLVKVLELIGGALVAWPKSRNFGLLILGPIIVNILAFNVFLAKGGWTQPPVLVVIALAGFLLWGERKRFAKLVSSG
jgi:putative oxidoreductase